MKIRVLISALWAQYWSRHSKRWWIWATPLPILLYYLLLGLLWWVHRHHPLHCHGHLQYRHHHHRHHHCHYHYQYITINITSVSLTTSSIRVPAPPPPEAHAFLGPVRVNIPLKGRMFLPRGLWLTLMSTCGWFPSPEPFLLVALFLAACPGARLSPFIWEKCNRPCKQGCTSSFTHVSLVSGIRPRTPENAIITHWAYAPLI